MRVELDARKTVFENAAAYYEKAKKIKAKAERLKEQIRITKRLIEEEEKKPPVLLEKRAVRLREWYEKFHWAFISGRLCIGGRDAKSNELVVKRHMQAADLYFHADVHGASSVVLNDGQKASTGEKQEAARLAACFSTAWKAGLEACDVFSVLPSQVKTAAPAGQYLPRGAFVIEGRREGYRKTPLRLGVAVKEDKIFIVPVEEAQFVLAPNPRETKGESAKKILFVLKKRFPEARITIDDVLQVLPNGGSRVAEGKVC